MNGLSLKLKRVRITLILCSKKRGDNISIVYILMSLIHHSQKVLLLSLVRYLDIFFSCS